MKKLMFSTATLVVLVGSTFAAIPSNATIASVSKPKPTTSAPSGSPTTDSIPPCCPLNDPNGCGIYD